MHQCSETMSLRCLLLVAVFHCTCVLGQTCDPSALCCRNETCCSNGCCQSTFPICCSQYQSCCPSAFLTAVLTIVVARKAIRHCCPTRGECCSTASPHCCPGGCCSMASPHCCSNGCCPAAFPVCCTTYCCPSGSYCCGQRQCCSRRSTRAIPLFVSSWKWSEYAYVPFRSIDRRCSHRSGGRTRGTVWRSFWC